ncbi:5'-methylthioadenosine/S-adenosylhomocysteine nucleosidase [Streptomyces rhizosphaericus]|uniref:5'-methylthioadenosine/S-adenosylhomocysteine nucleosidase n=2 Tax=Streptomyces rhizosphaericus TaxID=114699 RepID=UPI0027E14D5F|nr:MULTISPECIES: 5'-methylthioadenosine/S-adenosylhomocysteine nucleosidase [Streptomyces violaceusniger group]
MESTGEHSDSLVVLTALDVEYEAVRAYLVEPRPRLHPAGTLFEVGRLDGTPWRVALAELGDGNQGAAVLTERAITMFGPRAVAFVGVAGALKGDIQLGDVVMATHVYAYHGGKDEDGEFHSRPRVWPVRQELDQLARMVRRSGGWTELLRERPPGAARPAVHLKPVAAGEVVLNSADSPLRRQLRRNYQDAAAIEMEGAGVAQAAHLNAALPALIVRGISDRADGKKYDADAEGWQSRAARHAAAFAFSVLRELPPGGGPAVTPGPALTPGPAATPGPVAPTGPAPEGSQEGPTAPPPPPDAGTPPDTGPAAHRQLLRWARRFSDDLDLVDSPRPDAGTGSPPQLSGGLYVRRAIQDRVVEALYDDDPKAVLVTGDAGNGKSSLLWGLARDLTVLEDAEVFLVNAAWLLRPLGGASATPMLTPATVVSGATHARTRGRSPVVLLDTADLLLHDDHHEMTLLDLCEDLAAAGVRLVLTSRPEEANRLRTGFLRMSLGPYDDGEIPHAIRGHAALYCPDAVPRDDAARVRRLMEPVARGLPVREVCRSPLQLRLLFELARDDGAFPSAEIDATGLYRRYWDHRVVTDRRQHGNQSATAPEDLSSITGAIAVVLMSDGRTELPREDLVERLASPHGGPRPPWPYEPARVRSSLDLLLDRGVLGRGASDGIHFFHQTMFEYAAARGLLCLTGVRALPSLCEWIGSHPRDFFVGAILEQLLMLAAGSERYRGPVRETLIRMAAHEDAMILHTVAVAVAARNPAVGVSVEPLLATAPHGVARRYAVLAPTVRDTDVDALLPRLHGLWERQEPSLREAVLEALERLAAQNSLAVHAALADWGCVRELTGRRTAGAGLDVLPRLLVLTSHIDVASARTGLMEMLDFALTRGLSELASGVLTLWARHWETLGSAEWAAAVQERLQRVRLARKSYDLELFQTALARVLAASWTHDHGLPGDHPVPADDLDGGPATATHPWTRRLDTAVALLEADDHDTAGNAGLIAATAVLTTLPPGHWAIEATLDRCLAMTGPGAPHALQHRMVFPLLLSVDCAAAERLVHRLAAMLKALPCPENQAVTPSQRLALVARRILAHRDVPPHRVRQVLEHSGWDADSELWLSRDGLATLLLPAALGGHPTAVSRIEKATTAPAAVRSLVRQSLHRAVTDAGLHTERHIGLLVNLSLMDADTVLLEAITTGRAKKGTGPLPPLAHERVLAALRASAPALTGLIADEIAEGNSGKRHRQALTLWECSVSAGVLPAPGLTELLPRYGTFSDQKTRAAFLGLVGTIAAREPAQYTTAHTFLSELVFDAAGGIPPLDVASAATRNAARKALLHAACESGPLTPTALTTALDLAFAPPTDAGLISGLGQLVRRLSAAHGAAPAAELLIRVIGAAVASHQGRAAVNHLAKSLRGAMDSIFDHGSPAVYRRLWEHLKEPGPEDDADRVVFPERYALGLVSCAIRRSYATTRQDLEALVAHPRVPRPTKMWISDQLSARSREHTEHDLSWVLGGRTAWQPVAGCSR